MESIYYIGLDVHKKTIAYCIKTVTGKMLGFAELNTPRLKTRGSSGCQLKLTFRRLSKTTAFRRW